MSSVRSMALVVRRALANVKAVDALYLGSTRRRRTSPTDGDRQLLGRHLHPGVQPHAVARRGDRVGCRVQAILDLGRLEPGLSNPAGQPFRGLPRTCSLFVSRSLDYEEGHQPGHYRETDADADQPHLLVLTPIGATVPGRPLLGELHV